MDLEMGLAVLGVVAVTAAAVYLVSVMGIKEKSFEEAIAEQKKRSEDLLGRKDTKKKVVVKDKNKKQKKAKEKEKHPAPAVGEAGDVLDIPSHAHSHDDRHHVEILEEPEILDDLPSSESRRASVIRMRESLKSILVNKEEHSPVIESEAEPANHFEVIHPKGDLELKKHLVIDESPPPTPPPPLPQRHLKKGKERKEEPGNGDIPVVAEIANWSYYENVPVAGVVEDVIEATQVDGLKNARSSSPDEGQDIRQLGEKISRSKKNKREQDRDELTAAKLESTIERVSLSSSEIQNLIDILLNKQHAGDSEWVNKGKNDSVANLKKQLGERERQLNEEQSTVQTLQNKLKEIRQEFTTEKTKFTQIRRQLEDSSNQKMQDVQQLQVRLQQIRQEAIAEKQSLQQKLQQMQLSLNTLREENVAVKSALNVEQGNRGKADSLEREAEALRTQCGHLENQLKAAFQSNQDLSNQIRNLQEHLRVVEEHKKQEEHQLHTQYAAQIQEREAHLVGELKKSQELLAEGEKERINLRQQNSTLQNSVRSSQDANKALEEVTKKLDDSFKAEKNTKNLLEDSKGQVTLLQAKLQASESAVQRLEDEKKSLLDQINTLTEQKLNIEQEREKLRSDIQNSATNQRSEDSIDKSQFLQLQAEFNRKDELLQALKKETENLKSEVEKAVQDLTAQREKNNELRAKNTKLMDTLSVTEKNLETRVTQSEILVQEERTKSRAEAELEAKSTFQNLFPKHSSPLSKPDWIVEFAKSIQEEIEAATSQAQPTSANDSTAVSEELKTLQETNTRLQEEVLHYQDVLTNTESLLSNLQGSIEKEELKWHQKLQQKEAEISFLKGQAPSVNVELSNLKAQLEGEREEKSVLLQRCSDLENNIQNLKKQIEQVESVRNTLEKLEEDLKEERRKAAELVTEKSRLESVVIKEQDSSKAEKDRVVQLQGEVASLKKQLSEELVNSSLISSTTSNGVANGKSVDVSVESEPVVKSGEVSSSAATLASPHASTSSTTNAAPSPKTTNADLPISSKESKPKKKKQEKTNGSTDNEEPTALDVQLEMETTG